MLTDPLAFESNSDTELEMGYNPDEHVKTVE